MRIEVRIKQSEIRFRNGIKLVLFVAVAASIAWIINVLWLAKLLLLFVLFFSVVTLFEFFNAWRLKKKLQ